MKKYKFIAVSDDRGIGYADTPEQAIENARENALIYEEEVLDVQDFVIYEVLRRGRAKINIEWVSE